MKRGENMENKAYNKFKAYLIENEIKQEEVADFLGVTRTTFNTKLNRNGQDFSLGEVRRLCNKYKLDANDFFLI